MDAIELGKIIAALKLRVDQQPEAEYNLATFVPIIDFAALASPNSHIIYGRNGTGKTHLLKAFGEYCEREYEKTKVLPVYIDCKTLELGTVGPEIDISHLVFRYYRLFVGKIVETLTGFATEALKPGLLERVFGGNVVSRRKAIKASIAELQAIFRYEAIEERVKEYRRKRDSQEETKTGTSASLKLSLDKLEPKADAALGAATGESERRGEAIELVYDGLAVIDYDEVRAKLESILEQIGATSMILLIDEWSAIDLTLQPVLAEVIRKTLAVSKRIYLKVVALKYLTRLTAAVKPPQRIGLQPGVDIFPIADLDDLLCFDIDGQAVKDFLTLIAYRHCAAHSDTVGKIALPDFEAALCSRIFETPAAYLEIVRASEGNPRDFLSLLSACCSTTLSKSKPLSQKDAVKAAVLHFTNAKEANIKQSGTAIGFLYKKLFERVVQNKQKLFLITSELADKDERLRELLHYRFIHLVNPSYTVLTDKLLPHTYAVFSMDYGKLASLKAAKAGEQLVLAMTRTAGLLGVTLGSGFLTGYITNALRSAGAGDRLIQVAGVTVVSAVGVESGNADPETLVRNCVYDDLF